LFCHKCRWFFPLAIVFLWRGIFFTKYPPTSSRWNERHMVSKITLFSFASTIHRLLYVRKNLNNIFFSTSSTTSSIILKILFVILVISNASINFSYIVPLRLCTKKFKIVLLFLYLSNHQLLLCIHISIN
jgi:Na+/alanine symporter